VKYLLDTCLISELVKKKPNPGVVAWLDAQEEQTLFLAVAGNCRAKRRKTAGYGFTDSSKCKNTWYAGGYPQYRGSGTLRRTGL